MTSLHILTPLRAGCNSVVTISEALRQGRALPVQLARIYADHIHALTEKVAAGAIFDGPVAVLRDWRLTDEQMQLEVQASSYVPMTATRLTYIDALRTGLLSPADIPHIPRKLGACLCACVAVITADSQIVCLRRAAYLSNPGTMSLALGEVLEMTDFAVPGQALQRAGARALLEELGVTLSPDQAAQVVRPLYLVRGEHCGSWVFILAVDLRSAGPDFRADRVIANACFAKDAWEAADRYAIPFQPASMAGFLRENRGRLGLWADELVPLLTDALL